LLGDFIIENPNTVLPPEFAWSNPDSNVAGSLVRFAYAAERAGQEALHDDVRLLVTDHLNEWHGEQPGLGRAWVEDLVGHLDESLRPSARLALLAARASWQIDDRLIQDFRALVDDDRTLVQVTGWAAFAAVKRIASWL